MGSGTTPFTALDVFMGSSGSATAGGGCGPVAMQPNGFPVSLGTIHNTSGCGGSGCGISSTTPMTNPQAPAPAAAAATEVATAATTSPGQQDHIAGATNPSPEVTAAVAEIMNERLKQPLPVPGASSGSSNDDKTTHSTTPLAAAGNTAAASTQAATSPLAQQRYLQQQQQPPQQQQAGVAHVSADQSAAAPVRGSNGELSSAVRATAGPLEVFYRYDLNDIKQTDEWLRCIRRRLEVELDDGCTVQLSMQMVR